MSGQKYSVEETFTIFLQVEHYDEFLIKSMINSQIYIFDNIQ